MKKISQLFWQNSFFYSVASKQGGKFSIFFFQKNWPLKAFNIPSYSIRFYASKLFSNLYRYRNATLKRILFNFSEFWVLYNVANAYTKEPRYMFHIGIHEKCARLYYTYCIIWSSHMVHTMNYNDLYIIMNVS